MAALYCTLYSIRLSLAVPMYRYLRADAVDTTGAVPL